MMENVSHLEMGAVEIQTIGQISGLEAQVRRGLMQINPNLTMIGFDTFAAQVHDQFSQQELLVQLTSLFGLVALVLAAIGLYGVTAYSVAQRTSEIGVRMALGANRGCVLRIVLRSAFFQAGIGLLIGMPAAILAGHFMAGQLYGIRPWDPAVLMTATAILAVAAFFAAALPARRAAGIEPMVALRIE